MLLVLSELVLVITKTPRFMLKFVAGKKNLRTEFNCFQKRQLKSILVVIAIREKLHL